MKPSDRVLELCERLTSAGSAQTKLSASELHEVAEFVFGCSETPVNSVERFTTYHEFCHSLDNEVVESKAKELYQIMMTFQFDEQTQYIKDFCKSIARAVIFSELIHERRH